MNREETTGFFKFIINELKPKGKILTPFNIISSITIISAIIILYFRFTKGLGAVTDSSQDRPWGLWINFNVITGVAFAGGAYVVTFLVYVIGMEKYRPILRATLLYAFLAYIFYAGALLLDLGRPLKVINPIIGNSFGVSSILFLIAWKFFLYMGSLFIEFFPTVAEWVALKRQRKFFGSMTLGVVIFGIALSTLHQSGLGALFLMAKPKIHPLWYSEFIPILFFLSSIFAGLSLVVVLESIGQSVFRNRMSFLNKTTHKPIMFGIARICTVAMFVYFCMTVLVFVHGKNYPYLNSGYGHWYLVEIVGFVLVPCVIFLLAHRKQNLGLVRLAAVMAMIGIIMNRLNISTIGYRWYDNSLQFPTIMEIIVSVSVIFVQIHVFRWIARRMPVYSESPAWVNQEPHIKPFRSEVKSINLNNSGRKKWKVSAK